ncbi:hypothetical protein WH52_00290 [Tenacibaculum holothuriorum]|uniref:Uncharacterized protein n=1 Tax=Tenacibaculum holothuriorum TaxID=1635173 RepID=A0A1Y2PF74_9FLAO|nr:hypothetical protein [Tenacibaculum holothuriorum]OSY89132.1 hypothetical protein WH52_00290 [Tenacibaculum holothuriorum]
MIEKLINDFFNAIEEQESITSRHGKSVFFVEEILEKKHKKFNYVSIQTISRLQRKYIDKEENISVSAPDSFIKDAMAQYLTYINYEDYKLINSPTPFWGKKKTHYSNKNHTAELNSKTKDVYKKIIIKISITLAIFFLLTYSIKNFFLSNKECIAWKGNHYKKVSCNSLNAIDNTNQNIDIISFKKIIVSDTTTFFIKGKPNYWYGKNKSGIREFFTKRGIHPETKKELKPITRAILKSEGLLME